MLSSSLIFFFFFFDIHDTWMITFYEIIDENLEITLNNHFPWNNQENVKMKRLLDPTSSLSIFYFSWTNQLPIIYGIKNYTFGHSHNILTIIVDATIKLVATINHRTAPSHSCLCMNYNNFFFKAKESMLLPTMF